MHGSAPSEQTPPAFTAAVAAVRWARGREEVHREEVPGPARLAPWSLALSGEVDTGDDVASGRFVLLHDPAGQQGWEGAWRVVLLARAHVQDDLAHDPQLLTTAWGWVIRSLAAHDVPPLALGGTVTRVASQGFGVLEVHPNSVEVQVRASFSPAADRAGSAFDAWTDLLCATAGLPPPP